MNFVKWTFDKVKRLYGFSVTRPLQRYNAENRAFKAFDKQEKTPNAAPHLSVTEQFIARVAKEHPEVGEEIKTNPVGLLSNLKRVKVSSKEIRDPKPSDVKNRGKSVGQPGDQILEAEKLPKRTRAVPPPEFGVFEPTFVPPGKISLSQAIKIIESRLREPDNWKPAEVAQKFSIDEKHVEQVVDYFRPFQIYKHILPEDERFMAWYNPKRLEQIWGELSAGPDPVERWRAKEEEKEREDEPKFPYENEERFLPENKKVEEEKRGGKM